MLLPCIRGGDFKIENRRSRFKREDALLSCGNLWFLWHISGEMSRKQLKTCRKVSIWDMVLGVINISLVCEAM